MDLVNVLHMNAGNRECSYANSSILQRNLMLKSRNVLEESIKNYSTHQGFSKCFKLADLGCSCGPNTYLFVSNIVKIVHAVCQKNNFKTPDEFQVFLNDLPTNDFNTLFKMAPSFNLELENRECMEKNVNCFISGVAGSFFTRLFPSKSLHFVHSSSSVHWLSQVPDNLLDYNNGNIHMANLSPRRVCQAYLTQFTKDFTTFLCMRSEEIIPNGRMVLTLPGRSSADHTIKDGCFMFRLLAKSLLDMSAEGLFYEEDITSFNLPFYTPCTDELEAIIESESSFSIDRFETFEVKWDMREEDEIMKSGESSGKFIARTIRAVTESLVASHFGSTYMDQIFERCAMLVTEHLSRPKPENLFNIVISLIKK
ncbi:benzoate carboxyl methyltransferase-like [Apium graveolens]|uniref:benzoate carboxyl methyltransferase-like n=1 Tax=Apium graveolens TaxID=4045 RepID=UPI003D79553E